MRRSRRRITIRQQLAALVLVVALPLLGLAAYAIVKSRHNDTAAAGRTSLQLAALTASSVQGFIANAQAQMAVVAERPLVGLMDRAHCDPFLAELHRLNGFSANVTTIDLGGNTVCSAVAVSRGALPRVADTAWFKTARRTGRFTVGEPYIGRITHRRVVLLLLPVVDHGRRVGYLTLPIDLVRFQRFFARLATTANALLTVITDAGEIVARSFDAKDYVGTIVPLNARPGLDETGTVRTGVDGIKRIYASAPIAGTSWIASSGIPVSVAYGPSNRLVTTLVIVGAVLLALALAAALLTANWIARPVEALARRARDVTEGRPRGQALTAGPQEVVVAAERLDEMVDALEESEEQLRQSQKMEAVGQLAGGIAHDFNNLLTAISGHCELALARIGDAELKLRANIEAIAGAAERATRLTRHLLAFSRRQVLQPTVFDLNDAVTGSDALFRRLLGAHVEIRTSLAPDGCPIEADRSQVEQILMNLAVNARDAMPDGGILRIETETVELAGPEARRRFDAPEGEYALLRVADTGIGMDAETRVHALEPFFTTKPPGEGTGLGLSMVFGSVRQSGGYLSLASEPGAGTTFEILLPLVAALAPAEPLAASRLRDTTGSERILLVEDEPAVRALTCEILADRGYDVVAAADGEEAVGLAAAQSFDLVVTDMVMPKMRGAELAAKLRRSHVGLPVIFMSGYAYSTAEGGGLAHDDLFIQKPFSAHDLTVLVRMTLDSRRRTS